jgi:hypothetical protein
LFTAESAPASLEQVRELLDTGAAFPPTLSCVAVAEVQWPHVRVHGGVSLTHPSLRLVLLVLCRR